MADTAPKPFYQRRRFTVWGSGLLAAIVHGIAGAGASFMGLAVARGAGVDIPQLNLRQLGAVLVGSGLSALFAFLRASPIPRAEDDTDAWLISEAKRAAAEKAAGSAPQ